MKAILELAIFLAAVLLSTSAHTKVLCRGGAISAARNHSHGLKNVFEVKPGAETPDLISYEVTLADTLPNPRSFTTIEVTMAKVTCGVIENPVEVKR